jgi:hypothetical protein
MSDVELVHEVSPDRGAFDVVYAEDNPLWILAGLVIAGALLVIIGVLGAFYLAGVWLAGRVGRWAEGRGIP